MNRLKIYYKYFCDYIKHREFRFLTASVRYILFKKPSGRNAIIRTQTGLFYSRKGTIDFQFANYAYEWSVKCFILDHYKDYDYFFDIGANIGTYSVLLGNLGMKVIAFEPIHSNFNALMINILLNNLSDKITAYNFGLGDKDTDHDFIFNPVNTGASHSIKSGSNKGVHEMVSIHKLDSLLGQFGLKKSDKILMKVDVEGMEPEVFSGAKSFIQYFGNVLIVFESKHSKLVKVKTILDEIASFEYMTIDSYNSATKKK